MSFEEKKNLSENINNLAPEDLGKIVQIIHQRMPELAEEQDEIEIDIDALDPGTLRALERYVKQVQSRKKKFLHRQQLEAIKQSNPMTVEDVKKKLEVKFFHVFSLYKKIF